MSYKKILLLVTIIFGLYSCNGFPYKINLDQGNDISVSDINNLKIGMHKINVMNLIGLPIVGGDVKGNIWNYIRIYKDGHTGKEQYSKLVLTFAKNKLINIDKSKHKEINANFVDYGVFSDKN